MRSVCLRGLRPLRPGCSSLHSPASASASASLRIGKALSSSIATGSSSRRNSYLPVKASTVRISGPPALIRLHTTAATATVVTPAEEPASAPPPYTPPTTGLIAMLPKSWIPYAELTRMDKPTGSYYLFFPCLFSTLMAAPMVEPAMASPASVAGTTMLFLAGSLIMRGAGCTINDLWDRNLDPHVTRTRLRPIARGAVTPFNALVFTGAQLFAGLGILLQFPTPCLFYGIPSLVLVATYPLFKRVTYYPQFVLGLTFSWGAIMGFPALGIDLLSNSAALATSALLYTSNVAWTVLYDMIYAHMDIKDDVKAGIKSIALKHAAQTKAVLTGLGAVQIGLLTAAGVASGAGPAFFVGSCGGAAVTLGVMIKRVKLENVKNCWWWFVNGCLLTGGVVSAGMGADYLIRYSQAQKAEKAEKARLAVEA